MTALLSVLVVLGVVTAVAYPLWRPGPQPAADPVGAAAEIAALEERKRQLYGSIREIGFDYRMDKLEQSDYEQETERLKMEAAGVVRAIAGLRALPPRGSAALEAEIQAARGLAGGAGSPTRPTKDAPDPSRAPGAAFCTQCGRQAAADDHFCARCGARLRSSER